jgi:hypothetical protein
LTTPTPDANPAYTPTTAAVCGLPCDTCSIFISSHEDPERLATIAARWGNTVQDTYCDGCRADSRTSYCRDCTLFACARERGHAFCGDCSDYPCVHLEDFRRARPHRFEIYENLARISAVGAETWLPFLPHPQLGLRPQVPQMRPRTGQRLCRSPSRGHLGAAATAVDARPPAWTRGHRQALSTR